MLAPQPWLHRTFHTKELAHGYYGAQVGISVIIVLSAVYRSIENLIPVFRLLEMWNKNTLFFSKKKKVILQKANNFYREEGKYSAQSTVEAVDLKQLLLLIFFFFLFETLFVPRFPYSVPDFLYNICQDAGNRTRVAATAAIQQNNVAQIKKRQIRGQLHFEIPILLYSILLQVLFSDISLI